MPIPLESPDPDVTLDLNATLRAVYERAAYARRIDYTPPGLPPCLPASVHGALGGRALDLVHGGVKETRVLKTRSQGSTS